MECDKEASKVCIVGPMAGGALSESPPPRVPAPDKGRAPLPVPLVK